MWRQKLIDYETKVIKMGIETNRNYLKIEKWIITKKCSDHNKYNSLSMWREKFWMQVVNALPWVSW